MQQITAHLKSARFLDIGAGAFVVGGKIYGDTTGQHADGAAFFTSAVRNIEGDLVFTKDSTFRFSKDH